MGVRVEGAHRRSKTRTDPSAETEAKTPTPPQAMSYTSLSCAMSCGGARQAGL